MTIENTQPTKTEETQAPGPEISISDLSSFGLLIGFILVFFVLIVYHGLCLWGAQSIYHRHANKLIAKKQYFRMEIFSLWDYRH